MLGPFHTLVNICGAIGTLMEGSGLRKVLPEVYNDKVINHILSEKAVARALRAHLLVDRCLYTEIVSQAFSDEQNEYNELLHEVTSLYESLVSHSKTVVDVACSSVLSRVNQCMNAKKD